MADMDTIVQKCIDSEGFRAEVRYAERTGDYTISRKVRLYKELEGDLVRVVFPANETAMEVGSVMAITCLFDLKEDYNIYGHTIIAGPGVNGLLKAVNAPLGGAHPQSGNAGPKEIMRFVELKRASWDLFLIQELELGNHTASENYIRTFWKGLDRMFGGGYLHNCPDDYHWREN